MNNDGESALVECEQWRRYQLHRGNIVNGIQKRDWKEESFSEKYDTHSFRQKATIPTMLLACFVRPGKRSVQPFVSERGRKLIRRHDLNVVEWYAFA